MKCKAFTLIELITSIAIMSMVILFSMQFLQHTSQHIKKSHTHQTNKLEFLSTKAFIQKNISMSKKVFVQNNQLLLDKNRLYFQSHNLYFNKHLLLKNVASFSIEKKENLHISICTKTICQEMSFKS